MDQPPYAPYNANHRSYLLRIWHVGEGGGWRASLQSVQTGERHMFADLDSLLIFLIGHSRPPLDRVEHGQSDGISTD